MAILRTCTSSTSQLGSRAQNRWSQFPSSPAQDTGFSSLVHGFESRSGRRAPEGALRPRADVQRDAEDAGNAALMGIESLRLSVVT